MKLIQLNISLFLVLLFIVNGLKAQEEISDVNIPNKIHSLDSVCQIYSNHVKYFQLANEDMFLDKQNFIHSKYSNSSKGVYIKTNLLGLAAAILNVAVEFDFGKNLSFNIPVYYSAWNYFKSSIKMRTLAFRPEIRYWFSNNKTWFTGAHFGLAWYNFSLDSKYRYQDHDGNSPSVGGGLNLGYRFPLSKLDNNRFNIEVALGCGAYTVHYDKYLNSKNGQLIYTKRETFIGLDNATISVSYLLNLKRR